MKFSERIGINVEKIPFQLDSVDSDLRVSLWNAFYTGVLQEIEPSYSNRDSLDEFKIDLYKIIMRKPLNTTPDRFNSILLECHQYFDLLAWNTTYEFLEFFINKDYANNELYVTELNNALERENSGYRVIQNIFVPIIDKIEISSIETSLEANNISGVKLHFRNALIEISKKEDPNYANCIKESISAVESIAKYLTKETTLGSALQRIEKSGIAINNQLKEGFLKFYHYTNDPKSGIRHAIIDSQEPVDFDTAKFMLVACSAFINYLISISSKNGSF